MNQKALQKLEWELLLSQIASFCHTNDGITQIMDLLPTLTQEEVKNRWDEVLPLKNLIIEGHRIPLSEVHPLDQILKAARMGRILNGEEVRDVGTTLTVTDKISLFAKDHSLSCSTLEKIYRQLKPEPHLRGIIEKTVDEKGRLRDDASPELSEIRKQKRHLSERIIKKLRQIIYGKSELEKYLQDDFYTMRADRYVVPIKIDGRGRIAGHIVDTSASGQTLFLEPQAISEMNESLLELDLEEKIEIARIFQNITQKIKDKSHLLEVNYHELIRLDFLNAQALYADTIRANRIDISKEPCVDLHSMRHPLLKGPQGETAIPNDVELNLEKRILIISGPNAGGKTIVLKTLGIIHLMARSGLLIPAAVHSRIYLFQHVFVELGDSQSITENLSTFSGHIKGLTPIFNTATARDLILLDELAVGTEPQTGSAIAQAILEFLADQKSFCCVTTHYDDLKALAFKDSTFRNGSMEYSLKTLTPTYKLILDVPGKSYGLEVASQNGLPEKIIKRAKELAPQSSSLDTAVSELLKSREELHKQTKSLEHKLQEASSEKLRWEQEVKLLKESKDKTLANLKAKFEDRVAELQDQFEALNKEIKNDLKKNSSDQRDEEINKKRLETKQVVLELESTLGHLHKANKGRYPEAKQAQSLEELILEMSVYVPKIDQKGKVVSKDLEKGLVEVNFGLLRSKLDFKEIWILPGSKPQTGTRHHQDNAKKKQTPFSSQSDSDSSMIKTKTNTIDVCGLFAEEALDKVWQFLDASVMRGERAIFIVHGNGILKKAIRDALSQESPYRIEVNSGDKLFGSDGMTIVSIL